MAQCVKCLLSKNVNFSMVSRTYVKSQLWSKLIAPMLVDVKIGSL